MARSKRTKSASARGKSSSPARATPPPKQTRVASATAARAVATVASVPEVDNDADKIDPCWGGDDDSDSGDDDEEIGDSCLATQLPDLGTKCSFAGRVTNIGLVKGGSKKSAKRCMRIQVVDPNGDDLSIAAFEDAVALMQRSFKLGDTFNATDLVVKPIKEIYRISEMETELHLTKHSVVRPSPSDSIPPHATMQHNAFSGLATLKNGANIDSVFALICPSKSSRKDLIKYFATNKLPQTLTLYAGDETNYLVKIYVSTFAGEQNMRTIAQFLKADYISATNLPANERPRLILFLRNARLQIYNGNPTIQVCDWTSIASIDPTEVTLGTHRWRNLAATFNVAAAVVPKMITKLLTQN
jgi:hypothetical protein